MYKLTVHYYTTNFGSNHQYKDQLTYRVIQSDTYFKKFKKKIGEKGEAMNNMTAIVNKFYVALVLHQIIYFIKLKL